MQNALYNLRLLDDLAAGSTWIHFLNPIIKVLVTVIYLITIMSFDRYEIVALVPFLFYPFLILIWAELPAKPILRRIALVQPLIIGIGIIHPLVDSHQIVVGTVEFSRGWVTFLSLFLKSCLTVSAAILLIATTGIDNLAAALRKLGVPKIFVIQLLLTYRYIAVLAEEASRMQRAYQLRAPQQKGIARPVWGSFAGQLLLRTFDRAYRVYQAMNLRGFAGEYYSGEVGSVSHRDIIYLATWSLFFIIARMYNLPLLWGSLLIGGRL